MYMSKNPTRRLSPTLLGEDETVFNALQNMTGYTPANPVYKITGITQALDEMRAAHVDEDQGEAAQATRRDTSITREWAFHNLILGAKEQVIAQYGKDSTQLQELGLKRKSEYKTRKPKAKVAK
jgi:hypothetical protein